MPPGFHVIVLPFVDDIRAPPKNMTDNLLGECQTSCSHGAISFLVSANERQSKLMGNIIKRLRNKAGRYRSEVYPNPGEAGHGPLLC